MSFKRIVVALSGGVDSSVAALLLKKRYPDAELIGATLQLQKFDVGEDTRSCSGNESVVRARAAADLLKIPHEVIDGSKEFEELVLTPTWKEYARGRTPSPCLLCNEGIKFGLLLQWAEKNGIEKIATGHYARILQDESGELQLHRGVYKKKDQSYFLAGLNEKKLARTLFPLGELTKKEVRELAKEAALPTAEHQESQDACFVGEGDMFSEMLRHRYSAKVEQGFIVDEEGNRLGQHQGIHRFTIGQRKGIPIESLKKSWVKEIKAENHEIVITHQSDRLLSKELKVERMHWIGGKPGLPLKCEIQIRSQHKAANAEIYQIEGDSFNGRFEEGVRSVAPGQAAVVYDGDRVYGRGWIVRTEK